MGRSTVKEGGGKLTVVEVRAADGRVASARMSGEFFAYPEGIVEKVEEALVGVPLDEEELTKALSRVLGREGGVIVGVSVPSLAKAIVLAGREA